jgi:hypothetical protein
MAGTKRERWLVQKERDGWYKKREMAGTKRERWLVQKERWLVQFYRRVSKLKKKYVFFACQIATFEE